MTPFDTLWITHLYLFISNLTFRTLANIEPVDMVLLEMKMCFPLPASVMRLKSLINKIQKKALFGKRPLTLLWVSTTFWQCDPSGDTRLWIVNSTNDSIYYYQTYERQKLPVRSPFSPYDAKLMYPRERINLKLGTGKWQALMFDYSSDSSMLFYTFPKKIIETTPWEEIQKAKLYKVHKVKLKELEQTDWQVRLSSK